MMVARRRRIPRLAVVFASCVAAAAPVAHAQRTGAATGSGIQLGVTVRPETVTVGDHFTVVVRVRAPAGSAVEFPSRPDTAARVDTVTAFRRTDRAAGGAVDVTATYLLAAWDTGALGAGIDSVTVRGPGGDRLVPVGAGVYVRSVLPADTALRRPKPPRPTIVLRAFDWRPWALAAAALALALALFYAWRRWRGRRAEPIAPGAWAEREFARVERAGWIAAGNPARHATEMAAVLRGYLQRVVSGVRPSGTTRELGVHLAGAPAVPAARALALLERVDLVKFAAARVSANEAAAAGSEARGVVAETERGLAMERERAARERRESAAGRRAERRRAA